MIRLLGSVDLAARGGIPPSTTAPTNSALFGPLLSRPFAFDRVYQLAGVSLPVVSGPSLAHRVLVAQRREADLYAELLAGRIREAALHGANLCLLAYGPTVCDKSSTMTGEEGLTRGIMGLALEELLACKQTARSGISSPRARGAAKRAAACERSAPFCPPLSLVSSSHTLSSFSL
jgi:hypothetical protein